MITLIKKHKGLTLVELMTTIAIIAILSALAVPAYDRYTRKTNRTAAKTTLEQVRALAESYYVNNKAYTSDLTNLGFTASPMGIDKSGEEVAAGAADAKYQIQINQPGVFCPTCAYEIGAIPLNTQTADNADCGTLWINSRNQKGSSVGSNCW
jgi:type IV pilus assembly protein PilE